jgi:hypothetical protein
MSCTGLLLVVVLVASAFASPRPWMHIGDTPAVRAAALLKNMTLDDKVCTAVPCLLNKIDKRCRLR